VTATLKTPEVQLLPEVGAELVPEVGAELVPEVEVEAAGTPRRPRVGSEL